ncbi:hypothetical protein TWF481_001302 [Arthrobotrys musiformis]|uniref:Zn(2)-C6 fungal-type domain-containing protein n=1 Tax=Arthrobotrys musiformis TaxID=47236 RepID=A0AAV9WW91_9PEZI
MATPMDPNPRKRRRLPTLAPASEDSQPSASLRGHAEVKYKRHQAAKACNACRQAKAKCSEDRPQCKRCKTKGQECQYAAEDPGDQRRSLKDDLKLVRDENSKYKELFEFMGTASSEALAITFAFMKDGASLEDLILFIRDESNLISPTELYEITIEQESTVSTTMSDTDLEHTRQTAPTQFNLEMISDIPLVDLRTAPWTAGTVRDEFFSQLVSSFIAWDAISTGFIDPRTSI